MGETNKKRKQTKKKEKKYSKKINKKREGRRGDDHISHVSSSPLYQENLTICKLKKKLRKF